MSLMGTAALSLAIIEIEDMKLGFVITNLTLIYCPMVIPDTSNVWVLPS